MESGHVTLSFTEANYRQAMSLLITNKIPFSGTVEDAPSASHNTARQQALREISADMKNVVFNHMDYSHTELISIIEGWQKLLPC